MSNIYQTGSILGTIILGALKEHNPEYIYDVQVKINQNKAYYPYDSYLEVTASKVNPKGGLLYEDYIQVYSYRISYTRRPEIDVVSGSSEDKRFIEDSWAGWLERSWRESLLNAKNTKYASNINYKTTMKKPQKVKKEGGRRRRKATRRRRRT